MFRVNVSDPETGKSWQVEKDAVALVGTKIGEEFNGSFLGLNGYTLMLTGGSDKDGFPMRESVEGTGRNEVLMKGGSGYNPKESGVKRRKTVRGNTVSEEIVQVNTKVVDRESDAQPISELLGSEEDEEDDEEE